MSTGNGRPLVFGGVGRTGPLNDSFLWTNGTWVPVGYASGVGPPPLVSGALLPDPSLGNDFYTFLGGYAAPGGVTEQGWTLYVPFGGAPNGTAPLTTHLTASVSSGTAPLTVTFQAAVAGGEGPFLYSWSFGDGPSSSGSPVEVHTFAHAGTYVVFVNVTDAVGEVSDANLTIHAQPPAPVSPFTFLGGPPVWALLAVVGGVALWGGAGAYSSALVTRRIRAGVGHPLSRTRQSAVLVGTALRTGEWGGLLPGLLPAWLPGWQTRHQKRAANPFLLWLGRRLLLAVPQVLLGTTLLYVLSVVVPTLTGSTTSGTGFLPGWVTFNTQLFTGQWGFVHRLEPNGSLISEAPVITLLEFYLPDTLELAAISLAVATLVSYPLGLLAGWRQGRGADHAARTLAAFGGYFPLVALVLVLTFVFYSPFNQALGDSPFGTLPSGTWFSIHGGGFPSWIGYFGQTLPTGFPLMDGALAGAWPAEGVILAKTLFQSFVIGIAYSALFLRFARLGAASHRQNFHLVASRSRGVPERRLLWHDTSRLVLPVYVYTFGNTFAIFLVIQTLAEWFFNDTGFGAFLVQGILGQAYSVNAPPLVAVLAFLFLLVILAVNIAADALSRRLDPRVAEPSRGGGR
ncbi:Binding-protein-dependent transport system inner membrane component [mine drainage metagenome]|uniref:Binding-protein-dependent transport system inner membrane component n=1 Tax=mine drainage metagenome TaxID=410659 RepID=T1DB77_9ZZZZ